MGVLNVVVNERQIKVNKQQIMKGEQLVDS